MTFIDAIIVEINNREKSVILWTTVLFVWALTRKEIRSSFLDVLKAFFAPKLVIPFLILSLYSVFLVVCLSRLGLWGSFLLKDTIVWFFGVAFVIFLNINKAHEEDEFFSKILTDNLKIFILIQFIVNTYVFILPIELLLTPITTILLLTTIVTEDKEEYVTAHKFIIRSLSVIGFVFIIFSFSNAINDSVNFLSSNTFKKFTSPLVLTVLIIPLIYLMAVIFLYEMILIRLSFKTYYSSNLKNIKHKMFITCNINLNRLKKFNKIMFSFDLSTNDGLELAMDKIRQDS